MWSTQGMVSPTLTVSIAFLPSVVRTVGAVVGGVQGAVEGYQETGTVEGTLRGMVSGCGAVGSALPWGGRGRWFKSSHSDQIKPKTNRFRLYFLHFRG